MGAGIKTNTARDIRSCSWMEINLLEAFTNVRIGASASGLFATCVSYLLICIVMHLRSDTTGLYLPSRNDCHVTSRASRQSYAEPCAFHDCPGPGPVRPHAVTARDEVTM